MYSAGNTGQIRSLTLTDWLQSENKEKLDNMMLHFCTQEDVTLENDLK